MVDSVPALLLCSTLTELTHKNAVHLAAVAETFRALAVNSAEQLQAHPDEVHRALEHLAITTQDAATSLQVAAKTAQGILGAWLCVLTEDGTMA